MRTGLRSRSSTSLLAFALATAIPCFDRPLTRALRDTFHSALSIAPRDSYTTPRKPRDGSGTAPPAALRTPPLRRRSANPLKYQWLSRPVAWTPRKHIYDAGGRVYLTPDAAGCPELDVPVSIAIFGVFAVTIRHQYPGISAITLSEPHSQTSVAIWRRFSPQRTGLGPPGCST